MNFFLENKDEIFRLSDQGKLTAKESYEKAKHLDGCPVWNTYRSHYPLFAAMMKEFAAGESEDRLPDRVPASGSASPGDDLQQKYDDLRARYDSLCKAAKQPRIPEPSPENPSEAPRTFKGWTVRLRRGKYYELYKKIDGLLQVVYVGKHWKDQIAAEKIRVFHE